MIVSKLPNSEPNQDGLRDRAKRLFKFFWLAALSPAILLIAGFLTPTPFAVQLATTMDEIFWQHIKPIKTLHCNVGCHFVAFACIAIPASWLATIAIFAGSIFFAAKNRQLSLRAIQAGAAPYGRTDDGRPKDLMPKALVSLVLPACALMAAAVIGIDVLLYVVPEVNQLRTAGGRVIPGFLAEVFVASLIGLSQLGVAVVTAALTTTAMVVGQSIVKTTRKMEGDRNG